MENIEPSFQSKILKKLEDLNLEIQDLRKQIEANAVGSLYLAKVCRVVTISQVSKVLSCSRTKVYRLIKSGHLETVDIGKSTYISIKSLDELQTPK